MATITISAQQYQTLLQRATRLNSSPEVILEAEAGGGYASLNPPYLNPLDIRCEKIYHSLFTPE